MGGWEFLGSMVGSVVVGLLIKLVVALTDHYINVWYALLLGFLVVFGGVLLITGVMDGA